MFDYLVKEDEFLPVKSLKEKDLDILGSKVRREILRRCGEKPRKVSELAEGMDMDRQTVYYHLGKLKDAGLLKSEGAHPRMFSSEESALYYRPEYVEPIENPAYLSNTPGILEGFVKERRIKTKIIVGAPFPHGEYGRRHRTAYKAGDVACVLGNYGRKSKQLVHTDVEVENNPTLMENPLILVAGPRVNTITKKLNDSMPIKFDSSGDRILTGDRKSFSGEEIGFVAREEIDGNLRMIVAGISGIGTSAAIEALYSRAKELGKKGSVVQGFGTKENIEEIKILHRL